MSLNSRKSELEWNKVKERSKKLTIKRRAVVAIGNTIKHHAFVKYNSLSSASSGRHAIR